MFCRANYSNISHTYVLSSGLPHFFICRCYVKRITPHFHEPMFCRANYRTISYADVLSNELPQDFTCRCSVEQIQASCPICPVWDALLSTCLKNFQYNYNKFNTILTSFDIFLLVLDLRAYLERQAKTKT